MFLAKKGSKARYACSIILYWEGIIWRAKSRAMGITAIVPFNVPVAFVGYVEAIGLGELCDWHNSASTGPSIDKLFA